MTALPAGVEVVPLRFTIDPFRPVRPHPGNLLARSRVVSSGKVFIFSEVHVEDPEGRHIAQGSMQGVIRRVDPPPPPAPEVLQAVEEPVYETPDPYLRSFAAISMESRMGTDDGMELLAHWIAGEHPTPVGQLYGVVCESHSEGRVCISIPASEWFSVRDADVSANVIAGLGDMASWWAAITMHRPGSSIVGLDGSMRFLRPVPADGRRIRAEAVLSEPAPDHFVTETRIHDADGRLIGLQSGSIMRLDDARRTGRRRREAQRAVTTLLFTDIVASTAHAERLGDQRWRALLEDHKLAVRRELSRHNGNEVDTAGDGFFVRFDSPAQAVAAARAAVSAVARLGVELRAGVHTGECELEGNQPVGMAVHIAARIQASAQAGEVLVSSTVRDLTIGSDLRFADRGEHELKGVPDAWRLYAATE
jgi:class 3 adenylate cyclase